MPTIYLITGPAGVGKSTVSNLLSQSLVKSCLIEGDDIYNMVKSGYISPWKKGNHLDLFWKNVFSLIQNSLDAGFDVVFNYIINKKTLKTIKERFQNVEIKFVVLLVDKVTLIERDGLRPKDCQMGERCLVLLDDFIKAKFNKKYIIDTTTSSPKMSVDTILDNNRFKVE